MHGDSLILSGQLRSALGAAGSVTCGYTAVLHSNQPGQAEGLMEALTAAYQTSPVLDAQRAALRATDETVAQALSGWRPRVTASTSYGRQAIRAEQPLSQFGLPGGRINDRVISPISTGSQNFSQPIYRGGQTLNATRQAEAGVRAGRNCCYPSNRPCC